MHINKSVKFRTKQNGNFCNFSAFKTTSGRKCSFNDPAATWPYRQLGKQPIDETKGLVTCNHANLSTFSEFSTFKLQVAVQGHYFDGV